MKGSKNEIKTKKRAASIKHKVKSSTKGHPNSGASNGLKLPEINNNISTTNPYSTKKNHKQFESQSPNPSRTKLHATDTDYSSYYNHYRKKDTIDYNSTGANDLTINKLHANSSYKSSSHNINTNHVHDP